MARSASLDSVIDSIFQGSDTNSQIDRFRSRNDGVVPITAKKYMEIPIGEDTFELPLLAFAAFRQMLKKPHRYDTLVAQIYSCGVSSTYKSLDAIMRDVLSTNFSKHLIKVEIAGSPNTYYATFGAVFDVTLRPIMMLSWVMERYKNVADTTMYRYKRPLLRLNPYPCISKEDALQRFLTGKFLTASLDNIITTPYYYELGNIIDQTRAFSNRGTYHVKVEIDECPFIIRGADVPSVSVTNDALLQLAADHIIEIMQQ